MQTHGLTQSQVAGKQAAERRWAARYGIGKGLNLGAQKPYATAGEDEDDSNDGLSEVHDSDVPPSPEAEVSSQRSYSFILFVHTLV